MRVASSPLMRGLAFDDVQLLEMHFDLGFGFRAIAAVTGGVIEPAFGNGRRGIAVKQVPRNMRASSEDANSRITVDVGVTALVPIDNHAWMVSSFFSRRRFPAFHVKFFFLHGFPFLLKGR